MELLKLVFIAFFLLVSNSSVAQIDGVNIEVFNQHEKTTITVTNNTHKEQRLNIKANGYSVSNESSENLLCQSDVQEALNTVFEYSNDLRTLIHQGDLLRTIIHQDDLVRTIIHQDDLIRTIISFLQQNDFSKTQRRSIIRFFIFLTQTIDLFDAIVDILSLEGGGELLIDLLTNEPDRLVNDSFNLDVLASEYFEFPNSESKYDLIHVRVTKNSKSKGVSKLFVP